MYLANSSDGALPEIFDEVYNHPTTQDAKANQGYGAFHRCNLGY